MTKQLAMAFTLLSAADTNGNGRADPADET